MRRRLFRKDSPEIFSCLQMLARTAFKLGEFERAHECYDEIARTALEVHGAHDIDSVQALMNRGQVEQDGLDDAQAAERTYREAAVAYRELHGADSRFTLGAESKLGETLFAQGRVGDAEPFLRRAVEVGEASPETPQNLLGSWKIELARLLLADDRPQAALRQLDGAQAILESMPGDRWTAADEELLEQATEAARAADAQ